MGIEQLRAYVYYTCAHQHIITHLTGCVSCAVRGAHTLDFVRPTERTLSMLNVFFFPPRKIDCCRSLSSALARRAVYWAQVEIRSEAGVRSVECPNNFACVKRQTQYLVFLRIAAYTVLGVRVHIYYRIIMTARWRAQSARLRSCRQIRCVCVVLVLLVYTVHKMLCKLRKLGRILVQRSAHGCDWGLVGAPEFLGVCAQGCVRDACKNMYPTGGGEKESKRERERLSSWVNNVG